MVRHSLVVRARETLNISDLICMEIVEHSHSSIPNHPYIIVISIKYRFVTF